MVAEKNGKSEDSRHPRARALSQEDTAERLRMILNSARDGIIALDPNGCIDGVNPAIEAMFGYSEEELNGDGIGILYEETPTLEQVRSFLAHIRGKAGQTSTSKFRGKRKNGTTLLCEVGVTPMHLSNGVHYVAIVRDITERDRIEHMKGEFVATVSHELRTPLTSIAGSLGLLAGGAAGEIPPKALSLIKIAHSNSQRLVRLINDILDIEKIESGKMNFNIQTVPLAPLIAKALEGVEGFAEQFGVRLEPVRGVQRAIVEADPDRLMQVMTNLLSNAIKFSPAGAAVSVKTEKAEETYRVSVSNQGEGIPEEFRDRIFSRFAQADATSTREQGGTGLGLNIVKEIVTRLNGEVGFDSEPGEGATFFFSLPAARSSAQEVLICTGGDIAGDPAQLAALDIAVRFARSIEELRELLRDFTFGAIILDLRLTGAFRDEAVKLIQVRAKNSPLIVLVGEAAAAMGKIPLGSLLEWLERPAEAEPAGPKLRRNGPASGGRILHVEDDEDVLTLVAEAFGDHSEIIPARSLGESLDVLRKQSLDAVILDLELSSECGLELLPSIRMLQPGVPVVIFSASDAEASAAVEVDAVLTKSRATLDDVVSTVRTLITLRAI